MTYKDVIRKKQFYSPFMAWFYSLCYNFRARLPKKEGNKQVPLKENEESFSFPSVIVL